MSSVLETIKSSAEISQLFTQGKRLNTADITLLLGKRPQHDCHGRVAFIAGKKQGNAVWRNRSKRRMRALCRDLGGPWQGYDVVFIAKPRTILATYSKVLRVCDELLSNGLRERS